MRFAKNTQHDKSKVLRLPRKMTMDTSKVLHLLKTPQKYCACHTKRFSTRYKTPLNVTKCHACHAKRSNETFETSKNETSCRTYHRHRHTVLTRTVAIRNLAVMGELWWTVANGCERLRTVANVNARSSEHTLNPQIPRVKREPLLRIREKRLIPSVRSTHIILVNIPNIYPSRLLLETQFSEDHMKFGDISIYIYILF